MNIDSSTIEFLKSVFLRKNPPEPHQECVDGFFESECVPAAHPTRWEVCQVVLHPCQVQNAAMWNSKANCWERSCPAQAVWDNKPGFPQGCENAHSTSSTWECLEIAVLCVSHVPKAGET